jgi:hypothetical protein
MKEFIATETSKNEAEEGKKIYPLRQRDITLGAGLMFLGAIKALLLTSTVTHDLHREGFGIYLCWLGMLFSAFLLFSQLSPRQRGLTLGATMIFLASVLSVPLSFITRIGDVLPSALLIPMLLVPIIPFWVKLVRAFMRIFFDKEVLPEKKISPQPQPSPNLAATSASALQSAQNASDVEPTTNRIKEAEMAMPFSVTENTTETLKNKQSFTQS